MVLWPSTPHVWLNDWILWRFKGSPDPRPAIIPDDLHPYPYAGEVLAWCTWQRKGKPDPRPDITTNIPQWAFELLKELNQAVPVALPDQPIDWLTAWAITRFRNEPKPPNVPDDFSTRYPYVWSALRWFGWKRKGAPEPKPNNIPKRIPAPYWYILEQINIAVPLVPPPPPPPPPPIWENSWKLPLPIAWTAWGWLTDSKFRDNDEALREMFDAGIKTVALQIGQFGPNVPNRCRAFGFKVALWGRADSRDAQALTDANADAYILQIEGWYEYVDARNNLNAGFGQGLNLSVVTTLAGLETYNFTPTGTNGTQEVDELKSLGVTHAFVETYKQDGDGTTHFPISKMIPSSYRRGFPYANPLLGIGWRDKNAVRPVPGFPEYQPDLDSWGKQIGVYLWETMRPEDKLALKLL